MMTNNKSTKGKTPRASVDFVIITALEEERDSMLSKFNSYKKLDKEADDIFTFYFAEVMSKRADGSVFQVILASPLNMGPLNAATLTVSLVRKWKPKYVILTGIACGIRGEVNHGDIMISTQVADYTLGKQLGGKRQIRWEVTPSGASLLDSANNIDSSWSSSIKATRPNKAEVAKIKGVIASGGDVIFDDDILKSYSDSWPKLIGVEMESAGVAAAVNQTSPKPEFLMIKSVSDFGKDKHELEIIPWRKYACDVAAAFTLELIKSGPSQSNLTRKKKSKTARLADERRNVAERHWSYIQDHLLNVLEIHVFFKTSVGRNWLIEMLKDIDLTFNSFQAAISLKEIFEKSPDPNLSEFEMRSETPSFSFWEKYEKDDGYWCKRINPNSEPTDTVAGFDTTIPWGILGFQNINKLKDLTQCDEVSISFPPEAFNLGLEDVRISILGNSFSFSLFVSDKLSFDFFHKMAPVFHFRKDEIKEPLNFGIGFQGVELLDIFYSQSMPNYRGNKEKGIAGQSNGPFAIYFFPSMPKSFKETDESEQFSIVVPSRKIKDFETLEVDIKNMIKNNPQAIDNYVNLASLFAVQGRFGEAIRLIKSHSNDVSVNPDLLVILCEVYRKLGRNNEAIVELRRAEILVPDNPKIQFFLGMTLFEMNDLTGISYLERAVMLNESNWRYSDGLSRVLANLDRGTEALKYAKIAAESNRENSDSLILFSILLELDSRLDEALICLEDAIKMDPKSSEAFRHYAHVLGRKGEFERANENFNHSIELKKDAECYADWGQLLCDHRKWDELDKVTHEGLKIDDSHFDLLIYSAIAKANQADYETALLNIEKAKSINPNDKTTLELIAQIESLKSKSESKKGL